MIRQLIFAAALATALTAQPAVAADGVRNVVLVHGAWADGSSWAKVIPLLEKAGLNAVAVQNPLTSFEDDMAATKRAIALQDGPVILVGHSWGGVVITEAGADPKVAGLVYVAAFAPEVGVPVGELGKDFPPPPGLAEVRPDAAGYLTLTTKGVMEFFAPDLPMAQQKLIAATQGQTNSSVFGARVTNAAWKTKPSWYVVAANDKMIQPDLERQFAKTIKAKSITLPSSHVAMLSHPNEVAKLIIEAARAARLP
ncbi:MAG: alpha/beta hydrolase [Betaproteobacteria bacterium]|nr:MAG: alpha/beta hydrolase [Betaproteobacteria bacterium]